MKTFWSKSLMLMLVLSMLVCALSACSSKNGDPAETQGATTPPEVDTSHLYDSNGYLKDDLPTTYNFDSDFVIYTWEDQKDFEWYTLDTAPDKTTPTIDQARYARQKAVEERFGITFEFVTQAGSWGNQNSFIDTLAERVLVNDHAYDLVGQYTLSAGIGAMQGLYSDLNALSWLNLQKPWWPQMISETATIGDKLFFATGDITPTLIKASQCMFLNITMFNNLELQDLTGGRDIYDVVRDKDWTMEMLRTLGIGTVGTSEGSTQNYGITFGNKQSGDAFFYGAGFRLVENIDGVLLASSCLSTTTLNDFFTELKGMFVGNYTDVANNGNGAFMENRSLFYSGSIADTTTFAKTLKDAGCTFTSLPQPMLNKQQGEYYTCPNFWVTMYSVPIDAKNPEMSGMIMEGLSSESYRGFTEKVYFDFFQSDYDDSDSAEMFDIVSDSVVFDSGRFFGEEIGMYGAFRDNVADTENPEGTWASIYAGNIGSWEQKIANIYGKVS